MSQKEIEILVSMAKALPEMSEIKKGELLGYAKAMADLKKEGGEKSDSKADAEPGGGGSITGD